MSLLRFCMAVPINVANTFKEFKKRRRRRRKKKSQNELNSLYSHRKIITILLLWLCSQMFSYPSRKLRIPKDPLCNGNAFARHVPSNLHYTVCSTEESLPLVPSNGNFRILSGILYAFLDYLLFLLLFEFPFFFYG
jgi:hypothetical protein